MAGRHEGHRDVADPHHLAEHRLLRSAGEILAVADGHDGEGLGGGEDVAVAGAGMVRVPMRDQRPRHGPRRIDVEVTAWAVQPLRRERQEVCRACCHAGNIGVDLGSGTVRVRNLVRKRTLVPG